MGIFFQAFAVSDQTIGTILNDPLLVWQVVEHEDPEAYRKAVEVANRKHFLKHLWGKSYPAVEPSQLAFSEHELRMLDLDKSWDCLNFTFRTLWPEAPSFFEHAAEIAKLEVGLGPALYHSSQDMAAFAKNIESVSEPALLAAFDKTDLSTVYMDKCRI